MSLGGAGEGGGGFGAAEGKQDLLAGGLAGLDVCGQGGALQQAGGANGGHLRRGPAATCGAEVEGRVAAGAEVGGQEGEDDDVDGGVGAHLGKSHLAGCGGLTVVDCEAVGGSCVRGAGVWTGVRFWRERLGVGVRSCGKVVG